MPTTDPDADAFMRRILMDPTDPLPRLVFADWLEETGMSSNIAWANYLRLADELANTMGQTRRHAKLAASLARFSSSIRARLTLRAETVAAHPDAMLRLLPPRNLVANVETVVLKQSLLEMVPESVARENRLLLLGILGNGSHLFCAATPCDRDLVERIQFILRCRAVLVGMKDSSERGCFDRNYGAFDTEPVDSVHYSWSPSDGLRGGPLLQEGNPVLAFANLLLLDAFLYVATALEIETDGPRLTVWHWKSALRLQREYSTTEEVISQLVPLLQAHMQGTTATTEGSRRGTITVAWWDRPQTLSVEITDRPNGHRVYISIPEWCSELPVALNPAA